MANRTREEKYKEGVERCINNTKRQLHLATCGGVVAFAKRWAKPDHDIRMQLGIKYDDDAYGIDVALISVTAHTIIENAKPKDDVKAKAKEEKHKKESKKKSKKKIKAWELNPNLA